MPRSRAPSSVPKKEEGPNQTPSPFRARCYAAWRSCRRQVAARRAHTQDHVIHCTLGVGRGGEDRAAVVPKDLHPVRDVGAVISRGSGVMPSVAQKNAAPAPQPTPLRRRRHRRSVSRAYG